MQMDKILAFFKNNASLCVMAGLCVIPLVYVAMQKEKPNAKNLAVSAVVKNIEAGKAAFDVTIKNNDEMPYTYVIYEGARGMPSRDIQAEVQTGELTRQTLNRGWDPLPNPIPKDQIFIGNAENDKLNTETVMQVTTGNAVTTTVNLEGLPGGVLSKVTFIVNKSARSAPVEVRVP